jgi:zinc-ribbon domain
MLMRCEECGTENDADAAFCSTCGTELHKETGWTRGSASETEAPETGDADAAPQDATSGKQAQPVEVEPEPAQPTLVASILSTAWHRKGPILMFVFIAIMMAMVAAPWASLKLDVLGFRIVSNSYTGWGLYIPRVLLYLSIVPLLVSLMLIAGVGTRRGVVETHVCTFVGGVIFTVWIIIFSLSSVISSLIKNVRVLNVDVAGAQIATIFLFVGFMLGIIITSYDRGRALDDAGIGG